MGGGGGGGGAGEERGCERRKVGQLSWWRAVGGSRRGTAGGAGASDRGFFVSVSVSLRIQCNWFTCVSLSTSESVRTSVSVQVLT